MKNDNKSNDNYFEIKKVKMKEFEETEKIQKVSLLRRNIALGVISVLTSAVFGIKGYNPFLAFIELFTLPIGLMVLSDIKILSILKQKRAELMRESNANNRNSEIVNRGKKL